MTKLEIILRRCLAACPGSGAAEGAPPPALVGKEGGGDRSCLPGLDRRNFLMVFRAYMAGRRALPVILATALAAPILAVEPARAIEITPHRALYNLSLGAAKSASGVADARGTMLLEWADSCDGWTIEQRY